MNTLSPARAVLPALLLCLITLSTSTLFGQDKDKEWRPVTPDELALKAPVVESGADAEAIFWEVRIDDSSDEDVSLKHYVRVKVFTERGREKFSKLDVPFVKGMKVKDMAGRVIRPDGTIVEIKKEDIFEREIIKAGGIKVKAKSFAVPNIEPGVIVEYKYKEVIDDAGAKGMKLAFQRDIPVQKLLYYYKPFNSAQPNYQSYNFTDTKFVKDKGGFWLATRTDVPAIKDEPYMPPEDTIRAWMLLTGARLGLVNANMFSITYTVKDPRSPTAYWGAVGTERAGFTKFMNKESSEIKKAAAEITAGATTDDEKLRKIYEFVQTQIANTTFDPSITDEQRKKLPEVKSLNDVLKRRSAQNMYIDMLFGSLAHAAGFETRVVMSADRSKMFFRPEMTNEDLVHLAAVGVRVGDEWKFFNPGVPFLPYGMLVWYEEDTWALLIGDKKYDWKKTPLTDHNTSKTKRTGRFRLLEDGTLEGTVAIEMNGQPAAAYRIEGYDDGAAKLEESLKNELKEQISVAEMSDVVIENVTDARKPLVQKYSIKVPNYAQKTGKRLFLQPNFFKYGTSPVFSSSERKYAIYFRYPWSEEDDIEITWPAGFELDSADAPGDVGDPQKISSLKITMSADRTTNRLKYRRSFYFGGGGNILFETRVYKPIKDLFDAMDAADKHTVTLKQK